MKANRILIGAGLIILPFIFSFSGEQMREPKAQVFACGMGLFLSWLISQRVSVCLGAGAALCYISSAFCRMFPYDDLLIFSAALGSCFLLEKARDEDVDFFINVLEIGALLCAAYALFLQYPGIDPLLQTIEGHDYKRVPVFFGQHTLYGPFCVAGFAAALLRFRYYRAIFLALPVLLINASFTWLSFGVVLAIFLVQKFGKRAIAGMLIAGSFGAMAIIAASFASGPTPEALNDNGRFPLWKMTYAIGKARPIIGHGFGGFSRQFPAFQAKEIRQMNGIKDEALSKDAQKMLEDGRQLYLRSGLFVSSHNEFLQVFYELGWPGVLVALWCLFSFAWEWINGEREPRNWVLLALFASFMANSLGNFPLHLIPQALIPLWSFVAVTSRSREGNLRL